MILGSIRHWLTNKELRGAKNRKYALATRLCNRLGRDARSSLKPCEQALQNRRSAGPQDWDSLGAATGLPDRYHFPNSHAPMRRARCSACAIKERCRTPLKGPAGLSVNSVASPGGERARPSSSDGLPSGIPMTASAGRLARYLAN